MFSATSPGKKVGVGAYVISGTGSSNRIHVPATRPRDDESSKKTDKSSNSSMAVTKPCFLCRKLMPNDISDRKNNCYEVDLFSLLCRRILNIRPEFFKCRSDLKISNSNFCDLCKQRIRNVLSVWNQVRLLQCQLEAEAKRIRDDIRRHYDYGIRKEQILQNEELAVDVVGRLFAQCKNRSFITCSIAYE